MKRTKAACKWLRTATAVAVLAFGFGSTAKALNVGDVAFVGFNADGSDDFALVTFVNIPPGTVTYFTDNEWNGLPIGGGGEFTTGEGILAWNSGAAPIAAGTIVCVTNGSSGTLRGVSVGELTSAWGLFQLAADVEGLFAYQGTTETNVTVILAAIANDVSAAAFGSLAGSGLTDGDTAVSIPGIEDDIGAYIGLRVGLRPADYRAQIANVAGNWITQGGTGDQSGDGIPPDVPFEKTVFYVNTSSAKWLQPPDETPNGVDVGDTTGNFPFMLADDFLCTQTGPITGITVWASWFADQPDDNKVFAIGIWTDNPVGPDTPFSTPSNLLCRYTFDPATYRVEPYLTVPGGEWFYNPFLNEAIPEADHIIWRYYFPIDPQFESCIVTQEEGNIYWISVEPMLNPTAGHAFGWKSSSTHFNDDAVLLDLGQQTWLELRYPPQHPFAGESIDLAFAVDTTPPVTVTTTTTTTSSTITTTSSTTTTTTTTTAPDLDFGDAPQPFYPTTLSSNGAYHVIGGPWLGDALNGPDSERDGQPNANALGDDLDGNDDELGVWFPALIQGVPTNINVIVTGDGIAEIWLDLNGDGAWATPSERIYTATLTTGSYWFVYAPPSNAVQGSTFARCRISTAGTGSPVGGAPDGEVEDHNVFVYDHAIDWCNTQYPPGTTTLVNQATELLYGQVWIDGITSQAGATPGLHAQLGYGPDGTDPAVSAAWTWVDAVFNLDVGNNDEFMGTVSVPLPGRYDYAFRYSWYGSPWCYGDLDGSGNGYDVNAAGDLLVRLSESICPKWLQPPDCEIGIDVPAYWDQSVLDTFLIADDFVSDGRPITTVRWWGSYLGYDGPPDLFEPPPELRPTGFELRWYTDIPAETIAPWSMPGVMITNVSVLLAPYGVPPQRPGEVMETYYCTTDLAWMQPPVFGVREHEYEYTVTLPEPWIEKAGTVYWLSVRAIYPVVVEQNFWGWKTTPIEYNWNDDAVSPTGDPITPWLEMRYPPPGWEVVGNHPYSGESVNLAFELLTDVCPRRCLKWQQPPDMQLGVDMMSWRREGQPLPEPAPLRADDFISDGRRIADIHWWGSYEGWQTFEQGEPDVAPIPPPSGRYAPLGFDISWHDHDPKLCMPGPMITNIFVPIDKCHQVFYGDVDQSEWRRMPYFEHEYQYYVDLLDPEVSGVPWYEEEGTQYWLNIQAVFDPAFDPQFPEAEHRGWGWKTTPAPDLCRSAVTTNGMQSWEVGGIEPPAHPLYGLPFDLAFELTTLDLPATNSPWFTDVFITNITVDVAGTNVWVTSLGDCGCGRQILQVSTNLMLTPDMGYRNLATNAVPQNVNIWRVPPPNGKAFYRVEKVVP